MSRSKITLIAFGLTLTAFIQIGTAQQPTPMITVQAATSVATPAATAAPAPAANQSAAVDAAIKALEQVKGANEEMLKRQEAMLQQLDELQKAAEQLKIFSKRV